MSVEAAQADVIYTSDTIVIGQTCVGIDCNSASVADPAPTLTLQENNTRVALVSGSSEFQLVANSTQRGGNSGFYFETQTTVAFADAQVLASGQYSGVTIEADGRAKVLLSSDYSNVTVVDTTNTPVDVANKTFDTPTETYFYLDAGSFINFGGGTIYVNQASIEAKDAAGNSITASGSVLGPHSVVSSSADGNDIALGLASTSVSGAVSVGNASAKKVIKNVAAGIAASDAINVGQLDLLTSQATDQKTKIAALGEGVLGLSANAAALSALQDNFRNSSTSKLSLGIGFGYFKGELAGALGLAYPLKDKALVRVSLVSSNKTSPKVALQGTVRW